MKQSNIVSRFIAMTIAVLFVSILFWRCERYSTSRELRIIEDSLEYLKRVNDSLNEELIFLEGLPLFDSYWVHIEDTKRAENTNDEAQLGVLLGVYNNGLNKNCLQTCIYISANLNSSSPFYDTIIVNSAETQISYAPRDESDTILLGSYVIPTRFDTLVYHFKYPLWKTK